ncbi:hypothetical protein HID58_073600 [Brassica napus]|uniref:Uncharacterized protein n=1 Tax=Brassica napus TaxID=3708 RepID=A0ABQ7Z7Y6_BRANA|nr:hypothetical protein HID58_073600 [Brassica napus]
MASTLFSRAFLAASRRLITPSLLAETTLNLAAFLSKRSFYSHWILYIVRTNQYEPVVSVDWLHSNLREPDLKVLDASWYMPEEQRNLIQEYQVRALELCYSKEAKSV